MRGIAMRFFLGLAAFAWMLNNLLIGTIGGTLAEGLIVVTNIITIIRLVRAKRKYPDVFEGGRGAWCYNQRRSGLTP